jgi:hypothetical protein
MLALSASQSAQNKFCSDKNPNARIGLNKVFFINFEAKEIIFNQK